MLAWWAFNNDKQQLLPLEKDLEIEHIFSRNRQEKENSLVDKSNLEKLGNKALLEKKVNIRASDYRFSDKIKYYQGFVTSKGQQKEGTQNIELIEMSSCSDFVENDIVQRNDKIISQFIEYLRLNMLIN